jgi:adenylate cyclase
MAAVTTNAHELLHNLAADIRKGELVRRLAGMSTDQFAQVLGSVTGEVQEFLDVIELSQNTTFHSTLEQVLEAFTAKLAQVVGAERATLYLVDAERREIWARVAGAEGEAIVEARAPIQPRGAPCGCAHCAAHAAATGEAVNIADTERDPLFDAIAERESGLRTQHLLCVPVEDAHGSVFAVVELANKTSGEAFTEGDERRVREFTASLGVLLEAWWKMSCACPPPPDTPGVESVRSP